MENLRVGNQPIESPCKEPFIVHFSIDKNSGGGLVVKKDSVESVGYTLFCQNDEKY